MKKAMQTFPLNDDQVSFLLAHLPKRRFNASETLVYKGQTPLAGFVLLEGKMTVAKKGAEPQEVAPRTMVCVRELLENRPLRRNLAVSEGSSVIILDKSTILEMLKQEEGLFLTA